MTDCPTCYGTGFWRGFGAPCSEGCVPGEETPNSVTFRVDGLQAEDQVTYRQVKKAVQQDVQLQSGCIWVGKPDRITRHEIVEVLSVEQDAHVVGTFVRYRALNEFGVEISKQRLGVDQFQAHYEPNPTWRPALKGSTGSSSNITPFIIKVNVDEIDADVLKIFLNGSYPWPK